MTDSSPHVSSDDALPTVEPPSAGFIVQLFVVPAVIVIIIVMVWLMFSWLAQMGKHDPQSYLQALQRNSETRWQAAYNLASDLRRENPTSPNSLKRNSELARRLGEILEKEIAAGSQQDGDLNLRLYLSRALGEFSVPEALPALLKAASTNRTEKENEVRAAALQGIALLVENVRRAEPSASLSNAELMDVLLKAAQDHDPRIRSSAAYALGIVGTDWAKSKLETMLEDSDPDVRFNAATALVRQGDLAAKPVLAEMLEQPASTAEETSRQGEKDARRELIVGNALRAVQMLAAKNPHADLSDLKQAVEKLLAAPRLSANLRVLAKQVLDTLRQMRRPDESAAA